MPKHRADLEKNITETYSLLRKSEHDLFSAQDTIEKVRLESDIEQAYKQLTELWTQLKNTGNFCPKNPSMTWLELFLEISRYLHDQKSEAELLNEFGLFYDELNQKEKALEYLEQAL